MQHAIIAQPAAGDYLPVVILWWLIEVFFFLGSWGRRWGRKIGHEVTQVDHAGQLRRLVAFTSLVGCSVRLVWVHVIGHDGSPENL